MNGLVTRTFSGVVSTDSLSITVAEVASAIASGAVVVDIRSQHSRSVDGVITGALAIDPATVVERLTPGGVASLRRAAADATWIVIGDDGHDAEWVTWHLHARGATGARFLIGGRKALPANGSTVIGQALHSRREVAAISAH